MNNFIDSVISAAGDPPINATPNAGVMSRLMSGALTLKGLVSGGKMVRFVRFYDSALWYVTEEGFEFPVPVADVGTATMLAEDKAMIMMRYIRKHIELLKVARETTQEGEQTN